MPTFYYKNLVITVEETRPGFEPEPEALKDNGQGTCLNNTACKTPTPRINAKAFGRSLGLLVDAMDELKAGAAAAGEEDDGEE